MKTIATIIAAVLLPLASFAGTAKQVVLPHALMVAPTIEGARNIFQIMQDGDTRGLYEKYSQGAFQMINEGQTVYISDAGVGDVDVVRLGDQNYYAPHFEVVEYAYGGVNR